MKIKQGLVAREVSGEWIVIDPMHPENIVKLNETSQFIFEKLRDGKTAEDIVRDITETYDVTAEKAMQGVQKTVAQFASLGFCE